MSSERHDVTLMGNHDDDDVMMMMMVVMMSSRTGKWEVEEMRDSKLPGDKGLILKSRAKHHAISAQLLRPFTFEAKPLIIQ